MKAERSMQTFNLEDRQVEVRVQSDPKNGKTWWRAYLMTKPGEWPKTEMRLCERDNRQDCLDFISRYVEPIGN